MVMNIRGLSMLPKEIIEILQNNNELVSEEISNINLAIQRISDALQSASNVLMDEVNSYAQNTGIKNADKEFKLHQDSYELRKYSSALTTINTINREDQNSILDIHDVIVLNNTRSCDYHGHMGKDIRVEIPVLKTSGGVESIKILASYCPTCKRYTILKNVFQSIDGIIMCRVIDETSHACNLDNNENDFDSAQKQSIIFQYGYNVQSKINLTTRQRHIILASLVEANIQTRRQIIDHLTTLIERGEKIKNWKDATNKWKEDRYYVENYNVQNLPTVIGERIILKYKHFSSS